MKHFMLFFSQDRVRRTSNGRREREMKKQNDGKTFLLHKFILAPSSYGNLIFHRFFFVPFLETFEVFFRHNKWFSCMVKNGGKGFFFTSSFLLGFSFSTFARPLPISNTAHLNIYFLAPGSGRKFIPKTRTTSSHAGYTKGEKTKNEICHEISGRLSICSFIASYCWKGHGYRACDLLSLIAKYTQRKGCIVVENYVD